MSSPKLIDAAVLGALSAEARAMPRLRKNLNLHASEAAPVNRLLNAMEPGTYIRPHRHLDPDKAETFAVLRGRFGLVLFDDGGKITRTAVLEAGGDCVAADLPAGTWHTLVSLAPGTVMLEAKAGPYAPLTDLEKAPWAPAEGDAAAAPYLRRMEALFE
jgi:cupin fold WbuC family metalloprotein